jgi:hypothetical protein
VDIADHNFGIKTKTKKPAEVVNEVGEVSTTDT